MAQWLKALAALSKDPGSIPITDMAAYNHLSLWIDMNHHVDSEN